MTFFADLTSYLYLPGRPAALNIGWLDRSHAFVVGKVRAELREKLLQLAATAPVNQTRGYHVCDLCPDTTSQPSARWGNTIRTLGSAEIWVATKNGVPYACPDMIVHFVEVHYYRPPVEFLEALHN